MDSYPIPPLYLHKTPSKDGFEEEILDGRNRMETIYKFYNNDFAYCSRATNDKIKFKDLSKAEQNKFLNAEISVFLLENWDEDERKRLFLRLQNGKCLTMGERLNAFSWDGSDAIEKSESVKKFQELLKNCNLRLPRGDFVKLIAQACVMIIDLSFKRIETFDKILECLDEAEFTAEKLKNLNLILDCFCESFEDQKIDLLKSEVLSIFWRIRKIIKKHGATEVDWKQFGQFYMEQFSSQRKEENKRSEVEEYYETTTRSSNSGRHLTIREKNLEKLFLIAFEVPGESKSIKQVKPKRKRAGKVIKTSGVKKAKKVAIQEVEIEVQEVDDVIIEIEESEE